MIDFMLKDHSRKSPDSIAYRFPRIPILHLHLEFKKLNPFFHDSTSV